MNKKPPFGTLSDVEAATVEWLWKPFIPFGMLTIVEGDPGIGKSFLMMHLAAIISTGGRLPNRQRVAKGRVLLLSAEDDPAYTIRPRIDAMGGDPSRIRYLAEYSAFDDKSLAALRAEVQKFEPSLIVIDPLYAFVPSGSDMYRPNEIRPLLTELAGLAAEVDAALVVVRHLRKGGAGKAIYQGVGTIDVIGVARSAILVGVHPDDDRLRVVAHLKHSVARQGGSWLYELQSVNEDAIPTLVWRGPSELVVEDLLGGDGVPVSALTGAVEALKDTLKEGAKASKEVSEALTKIGHSERTIARAKDVLGVKSFKQKDRWFLKLPD